MSEHTHLTCTQDRCGWEGRCPMPLPPVSLTLAAQQEWIEHLWTAHRDMCEARSAVVVCEATDEMLAQPLDVQLEMLGEGNVLAFGTTLMPWSAFSGMN